MSDWEELEKELAGLTPRAPSKDFSKRVEDALGEAGSVAMRHTPDYTPDSDPARTTPSIHFWIPLGLAALLVFSLYLFNPFLLSLKMEILRSLFVRNHQVWLMMRIVRFMA
jgi:hypothetical protein